MEYFRVIKSFVHERYKTVYALFAIVFVVAGVGLLLPHPVYALGMLGSVIAQVIAWIVSAIVYVIGLLISSVISILIALASYNEFINAPAVTIGWLVLRDIANMIVVVLLLVIAVATILSVEAYQYKHLLPRLLIMAVMVNFSKTIVGFLIDASQVVMLTFVAAFREAGAGNFIAALNLEKMLSINPDYTGNAGFMEILGGLFLALILMVIALIVLLVMTMIIGFRIVMLWILTVMSPLVFILSAIEAGREYYAKWWKQLTNYLIVGPVLAFFIWLTLAATGGTPGSDSRVVQTFARDKELSYFATREEQAFITAAGHWQNLIGFIIAISMLIGGLMITEELGVVGSGFARSALEGLKHTGKSILKNAGKGAMEVGAWAARKVKAGKAPGLKWARGVELNPMAIYRNIKEQLEEKKHREEKEGYIQAVGRLEKGGLSGMVLGLGSKSWVENYGEGFMMRKGFTRALKPWLTGRTEQHVKDALDAEKKMNAEEGKIDQAKVKVAKIDRLDADMLRADDQIRRYERQINSPGFVNLSDAQKASLQRGLFKAQDRRQIAGAERVAMGTTKAEQEAIIQGAERKRDGFKALKEEADRRAKETSELTPQDFEGRKMRRAEINERAKKYDTSNEEELVPLFQAAVHRGDMLEAAAVAKKAYSVGHGNEIIQSVKLEKGEVAKYGRDDQGNLRTHPNNTRYEDGDYLSCDADGMSIMINKVFVDGLKMARQEAFALQSDLSAAAEGLPSRWYNIAQTVGALPDGTLRQRTKAEQMLRMGIEQDKGDNESMMRQGGRAMYGGEMYKNPKDPSSGRVTYLDERAMRWIGDNFGMITERGLRQGRVTLSAVMNVAANPENAKLLEGLREYLRAADKDKTSFNKKDVDFNEFVSELKNLSQSTKGASRDMAGAATIMGKTLRDLGAVRRQAGII